MSTDDFQGLLLSLRSFDDILLFRMNLSRNSGFFLLVLLWILPPGAHGLFALEPQWTRVLSGALAARPVVHGERVFALTDDRTLTCLNSSGNFLWSRQLRGRPARYISVADNGLVQALSGDGVLNTLSRDGVLLWSIRCNREPACPPVRGWDGRTVVLFSDHALCLTDTGSILWHRPLAGTSFRNMTLTGDGNFLLYNDNGDILLLSPFGSILAETALSGKPVLFAPVPAGFVATFSDGTVSLYDVRSGKNGYRVECLWAIREESPVAGIIESNGTLYTALRNGSVMSRNVTDAALLWKSPASDGFSGLVYMDLSYSRITVFDPGTAVSLDERGNRLWRHEFSPLAGTGTPGLDGMVYGAGSGWSLAAWRAEARILSRKDSKKTRSYGILELSFPAYAYMNTADQLYSFLNRVDTAHAEGRVGDSEPLFARWLVDIVEGSFTDPFSEKKPDSTARGRAASLLGRLGSEEYRPVLLAAANGPFDESLAIGVIHGLSGLGCDPDGESVDAVTSLAKRSGVGRPAVHYAACDALLSLARFSSGDVRDRAVRAIVSFSADPWTEQVQKYAHKALEALLHQ